MLMDGFIKCLSFSFLMLLISSACKVTKMDDMPEIIVESDYLLTWEKDLTIPVNELKNYWGNNDTANAFIEHDVEVYRITYQSEQADGERKTLSGAVLVPQKTGAKSVISIQHATFFADEEAPSVNQGFSVVSRKSIFAAHGYIVFLPDYHGFGVDRDNIHPYHDAETLQSASEDMLLAGYEFLTNKGIDFTQKLFLAGYSEGAYATAALQQSLEKRIDLAVTLTATSLGSGAYNMKATFEQFTSPGEQVFGCVACNAFFLQSYNEVNKIGHPLSYYFQEPYQSSIEAGLFLGDFDAGEIAQQLTEDPAELLNPAFILNYYLANEKEWERALVENSIHEWQPKHPTFITHNEQDNVAPFFNSQELAIFNEGNSNVVFLPIPNTDHFSGIFQWGILTIDYFDKF